MYIRYVHMTYYLQIHAHAQSVQYSVAISMDSTGIWISDHAVCIGVAKDNAFVKFLYSKALLTLVTDTKYLSLLIIIASSGWHHINDGDGI